MGQELRIRRAQPSDFETIEALVIAVRTALYGHLLPGGMTRTDEDWSGSHVAELVGQIVGVVKSDGEVVEDLWLAEGYRGQGIGAELLRHAEREIEERGHPLARLRVVAENERARAFYRRQGWREVKRFRDGIWGFEMIAMVKDLKTSRATS